MSSHVPCHKLGSAKCLSTDMFANSHPFLLVQSANLSIWYYKMVGPHLGRQGIGLCGGGVLVVAVQQDHIGEDVPPLVD